MDGLDAAPAQPSAPVDEPTTGGPPAWLQEHCFKRGTSANPGGRTPAAIQLARILAAETGDGAEIVDFVLSVLRNKQPGKVKPGKTKAGKAWSEKSRLWAADWATVRLWGKPKETIDLNIQPPGPRINYDALTPEELDAFDRLMAKAMGQAEPAPQLPGRVIDVPEESDDNR